jgi:hypothetical protein
MQNMKKLLVNAGFIVGAAFALTSCYPGGAEYVEDTDLVYTNYDPDYDFGSVNTYYLSDSIQHIVDEGDEPDKSLDSFILDEIKGNLNALGWQEFNLDDTLTGAKPDIVVVSSLMVLTTYNIYYYPWYPGWGYYWKNSDGMNYYGYGWYYPWYGTSYVTSYSTGTVIILFFDPDNVDDENQKIGLSWVGVLNGLAGSGKSSAMTRISKGMDQAFKQSPYLQGN